MATRTRMSREARQDQLLQLGAELFADRSYEDVHIEELSEVAGVSRGLLYHYFPTKRAFFAAMVRRESSQMMEITAPDESLPILDRLRQGIEAYLDYCQDHKMGVKAIFHGAASADPEIQAIIEDDMQRHPRPAPEGCLNTVSSTEGFFRHPYRRANSTARSWSFRAPGRSFLVRRRRTSLAEPNPYQQGGRGSRGEPGRAGRRPPRSGLLDGRETLCSPF